MMQILFDHQLEVYLEVFKSAFLMSLLTGRDLVWALAVWDSDMQLWGSFTYYLQLIWDVFDYPAGRKDGLLHCARALNQLRML